MTTRQMPIWRQVLANLYYHMSYPGRRWYRGRSAAAGRAPIGILIFHRVADDAVNDWTTPTADFIEAIRWLKRHSRFLSLAEVQQRLRSGRNSYPSVSITFDDGYAENCDVALPLLVKERIPCTYFVSTGPVLEGRPFPHDLEMGNRFPPNTIDQLKEFSEAGIEIGAHTRTHADMGRTWDRQRLLDEIVTARDDLEAAVGCRIRYFAFPFGRHENLSVEAFQVAREAGYAGVCSAYGGYNFPGDDAFHLQRRGVDGPVVRLKNWALVDPVRHFRVPRFSYSSSPAPLPRMPVAESPMASHHA